MKEKLKELGLSEEQILKIMSILETSEDGRESVGLKNEVEKLRREARDYEERINELKADSIICEELRKAGARNIKACKALLDAERLLYDEESGKVIGLDEQIKELVSGSDTSFLFGRRSGLKGVRPAYSSGKPEKKDFKDFKYKDWVEYYRNK